MTFKDALGRKFISLTSLSSLLELSKKQVLRHIEDKKLLNVKKGRERFVLTEDVNNTYPHLKNRIGDMIGDIEDISVRGDVSYVRNKEDIEDIALYKSDKSQDMLLQKMDHLSVIASQFERSASDIDKIQKDTKAMAKALYLLDNRFAKSKIHHGSRGVWVFASLLAVGIAAVVSVATYAFMQFNEQYNTDQDQYASQLLDQETSLGQLATKYGELSTSYAEVLREHQKTIGEKELEISSLKQEVADFMSILDPAEPIEEALHF